jgi:hypothetical protein
LAPVFVVSAKCIDPRVHSKEKTLQHKLTDNPPFMYIFAEPPKVTVINVTSHFGKTRLDCLAQGIPALYNFSRWEHKSMFGEHIRYLDGFDNLFNYMV